MTNAEKIYTLLKARGYTLEGVAAILGNLSVESGVEPVRLEGDFAADRAKSYDYMKKVDNGQISREEFGNRKTGWGLAQWTYPARCFQLYDYCKSRGVSIGDLATQVDFLDWELRTSFYKVYKLCQASSLADASYAFLMQFENPRNAAAQVSNRYNLGLKFYNILKDFKPEESTETAAATPEPVTQIKSADYSLLPILSEKKHDTEHTAIMHQLLFLHGYAVDKADEFDVECLRTYQEDHPICGGADGFCGAKTWKSLIEEEDV